jgi:transcriptional regulator with XRE-family HTH domain
MSRQELADAVNAYGHARGVPVEATGRYVGRLERGETRWPGAVYRQAFRAVLGAATNAGLGFYITRPADEGVVPLPVEPTARMSHAAEPEPVDAEQVRQACLDLGRQLATWRHAAGLTQAELARRVFYARSAVAGMEIGREHLARRFWERADEALRAGGVLLKGYDEVEELVRERHRQQALAQARTRAALAPPTGCGCGLVVASWTALEVRALRQAMRLPVRAFAHRLGVSVATVTVTVWERVHLAKVLAFGRTGNARQRAPAGRPRYPVTVRAALCSPIVG